MSITKHIQKKSVVALSIFALLFIAIQFIQQSISNPPVTHPIQAPEAVVSIFKRACYDCHSNETKPIWTTRIAPVSWIVSKHIKTGRSRFNFSTWDTLDNGAQRTLLWEMVNMVLDKKMPLASYTINHPEAKITQKDIAVLEQYVNSLSPVKFHDTALIRKADTDYNNYISEQRVRKAVPVSANGVQYVPGFRNWQVISTTNRFDNNRSIRVIYANSIAVAAVKQNRINPWPQGSVLVKVVWDIIEEKNGDVLPGAFNNVQIMIKDDKRFPDSEGWGFAKFSGTGLKPYGSDASFNTTCFNCHKAAAENGFVFNVPLPNGELMDVNTLH